MAVERREVITVMVGMELRTLTSEYVTDIWHTIGTQAQKTSGHSRIAHFVTASFF